MLVENGGVVVPSNKDRPSWTEWFFEAASWAAKRGDCRRRQVGAVLVIDQRIIATGYNGVLRNEKGCLSGGCPRGLLGYAEQSAGGDYVNCSAIHAELNAILDCARRGTSCQGSVMYVTTEPCQGCARLIKQAGVSEVFWKDALV